MSFKVGIVGGGAAGLFTACQFKRLAGGRDIKVTIIERGSVPGVKLTLTGHGRCNITNRKDATELKRGFHEAEKFIYPALREFGPEDTMAFVEKDLGLKLKEEDNNRIFPVCDSAVKVRDAILSYISDCTKIVCNTKVLEIKKDNDFKVVTDHGDYYFDCIVLSCGGSSFAKTGSTGDSYRFAESLGHKIEPVRGALVPIRAGKESVDFCKTLSGVTVKPGISLYCDDKKIAYRRGEMLFADFGLTGPAAMEIAREIPADIKDRNVYLELDLVPSMQDDEFERELLDLIGSKPDSKMWVLLARYVPASVDRAIGQKTGTDDLYAQSLTKENRKKICREYKHLKIDIEKTPELDKAYVTRGGVSLKEVDRKTMGSKIVPGLYILGEALDVDGISGGYNLQACMSEAYLAVKHILSSEQQTAD